MAAAAARLPCAESSCATGTVMAWLAGLLAG